MYKILLFTFFIGSIQLTAQENKNSYFEGEVHFRVSCRSLDSRIPQEYLENEIGDSFIGKVKENKYLMIQNTNGIHGNYKAIMLLDEGIGYEIYEKSDMIYRFSLLENPDELIEVALNEDDSKVILEDTCKSVTIKYKPSGTSDVIEYVEAKYYFNSNYKLSKEKYKNHNYSFWNKFVDKSGSISVRNEILTYPLYETVYQAVEIIEKEIAEEEFEIDVNKIIVER